VDAHLPENFPKEEVGSGKVSVIWYRARSYRIPSICGRTRAVSKSPLSLKDAED